MNQAAPNKSILKKFVTAVGILLCVVLVFVLIINTTLIVKSYAEPDKVPSFLGYKPFIVLSGSMEPVILPGDLIITKNTDPTDIKVGDIITFRQDKTTAVSHRVTEVLTDGGLAFHTKGDANVGADLSAVSAEALEGKYILRIGKIGNLALFLQTPIGLLIFVVTPLCLFIVYDVVVRNARKKKQKSREAELEAELEALKAAASKESAAGNRKE